MKKYSDCCGSGYDTEYQICLKCKEPCGYWTEEEDGYILLSCGWCCEECGVLIKGKCYNKDGFVLCLDCWDLKYCDVCKKQHYSVRFEGETENFICDECLYNCKGVKAE